MLEENILASIKKLLGFEEDYTAFDTDIMMHINSAFMGLYQLGVGPAAGYALLVIPTKVVSPVLTCGWKTTSITCFTSD